MHHKKEGKINRLKSCVMICQSLNANYDSSSPFGEIGNYAAIDYTLNWLSQNSIEEVFMFYSTLKNEIEEYSQTIAKSMDLKLKLHYMKPTEMKSLGDVMREVRFRDLVSEDFLVVYADMITNVNLTKAIAYHFDKKVELRNVVLTSVMRKGQTSELMIINSHTSEILQIQQSGKEFQLNTQKVNLKKLNVEFRRDLTHSDIFICTIEVLKAFKETEQHQTMHDFIVGMLTSEVYQQKILSYQLKAQQVAFRINKSSNRYLSYMNFISGYLYPYSLHFNDRMSKVQRQVQEKTFTVKKFNRIFRKGVKVIDTATLSNNIYLGQNSRIEGQCKIQKSIIGKNVIIGKNTILKECIVLDDVKIAPSSCFQYCLLEKTGATVKITSFRSEIYDGPIEMTDKPLFEETPQPEKADFSEQLKHILDGNNEDETITVSQIVRIRMEFQKTEADLTKEIFKILAPKGTKGIEHLTQNWGEVLLKVHHEDENEVMDSLFFACTSINDYEKAFHLFLQYFYHFDILSKNNIIEWIKSTPDESPTLKLCQPFLEKLETESEDEQDEDQDES